MFDGLFRQFPAAAGPAGESDLLSFSGNTITAGTLVSSWDNGGTPYDVCRFSDNYGATAYYDGNARVRAFHIADDQTVTIASNEYTIYSGYPSYTNQPSLVPIGPEDAVFCGVQSTTNFFTPCRLYDVGGGAGGTAADLQLDVGANFTIAGASGACNFSPRRDANGQLYVARQQNIGVGFYEGTGVTTRVLYRTSDAWGVGDDIAGRTEYTISGFNSLFMGQLVTEDKFIACDSQGRTVIGTVNWSTGAITLGSVDTDTGDFMYTDGPFQYMDSCFVDYGKMAVIGFASSASPSTDQKTYARILEIDGTSVTRGALVEVCSTQGYGGNAGYGNRIKRLGPGRLLAHTLGNGTGASGNGAHLALLGVSGTTITEIDTVFDDNPNYGGSFGGVGALRNDLAIAIHPNNNCRLIDLS